MNTMVRWRALLLTALACAAMLRAHAEQTVTLLSYTNAWHYNQDAVQLPPAWRQPGFNDASWLMGEGVFGVPGDESLGGVAPLRTVLSLYAPTGAAQVITYYFRTQFEFPYVPDGRYVFTASNLIDDGAVFYVNGTEVGRVGMPPSSVTYFTLASRGIEVSSSTDRVVIPRTAIVQGLNTLAVEVHQSSTNSSDAVFGLSLTGRILDPVQIVCEPEDVTLEEGQTLRLSVDVTGSDPSYQWYRDTTRLANYPTRELVWENMRTDNAGLFYVVVSNSVNVVTSRFASVTVLRDTNPPVLLYAEEYLPPYMLSDRILLTFSEPISRIVATNYSSSGTNWLNYSVHEFGTTNLVNVMTALVGVGTNTVRLTLGPLKRTSRYVVTVTNLADVRSNIMTRPSFAYVGFYASNALVNLDSIWAWDESGADLGTAWRQRDYDDRHWGRGRGIFAFEFDSIDLCGATKNTALSLGSATYYFRFPFVVSRTSGRAVFAWVAETIDDGAIMYLNGQELRRVNMPAGPVTATTPALATREGTCFRAATLRSVATNLVEGTNVLAVEVHQATADFDVVFGMQIDAFIQLPYPVPVPLKIARASSGEVVLSWTGREGSLKSAASPLGPWLPLATNSPVVLSPNSAASFFRLDPFSP